MDEYIHNSISSLYNNDTLFLVPIVICIFSLIELCVWALRLVQPGISQLHKFPICKAEQILGSQA